MLKTHKDFDDSFAELLESKRIIEKPKLNIKKVKNSFAQFEITPEQISAAMASISPSYFIYHPSQPTAAPDPEIAEHVADPEPW